MLKMLTQMLLPDFVVRWRQISAQITETKLQLHLKNVEKQISAELANFSTGGAAVSEDVKTSGGQQRDEKVQEGKLVNSVQRLLRKRKHQLTKEGIPNKMQKRSLKARKPSESMISNGHKNSDILENGASAGEKKAEVNAEDVEVDRTKMAVETKRKRSKSCTKDKRKTTQSVTDEERILQTDVLYHVLSLKEEQGEPDEPKQVKENEERVEIPGWREKPLAELYRLEGTENCEDERFHRMHRRLELEEKRSKRQSLEYRQRQLVVDNMRNTWKDKTIESASCEPLKTFLPSLEDLTHIEIRYGESVPVMAFGCTVPYIEPSDFILPWDIEPSPDTSDTQPSAGQDT